MHLYDITRLEVATKMVSETLKTRSNQENVMCFKDTDNFSFKISYMPKYVTLTSMSMLLTILAVL